MVLFFMPFTVAFVLLPVQIELYGQGIRVYRVSPEFFIITGYSRTKIFPVHRKDRNNLDLGVVVISKEVNKKDVT